MKNNKKKNNNVEFSKWLLKQESILVWIVTLACIVLSFYSIWSGYIGELPWLVGIVGFPWSAYGVSQTFYYKKSMAENTRGGIKYETIVNKQLENDIEFINLSSDEEVKG